MSNVFRDREILSEAQAKGPVSTLGAYFRLSGPGWLQSAITLGGGSLAGALYLGMAGGYSLLWVQVVAITCGVIMLSAISYITLSTGKRPYAAMNEYVNPVLGTAWVTATILVNMIFIMPQFALAYRCFTHKSFARHRRRFAEFSIDSFRNSLCAGPRRRVAQPKARLDVEAI